MGPKSFSACYVCFKEFGSKSITFHEPRCLERWRSSNKSLPADKRTKTPVKPSGKNSDSNHNNNSWVCSHCRSTAKKSAESDRLKPSDNNQKQMTGVVKSDFSPKKGKENKNVSNQIPPPSVLKKNAKNDAKDTTLEPIKKDNDQSQVVEDPGSTSKRSVRPQTKILRRPTPNLKHPVIQVDSDDSGDSTCSDKSKDDNPKRLKMGIESSDSTQKPKNFIAYNKNNVDRKLKHVVKERTSATVSLIPNPCNSCNRSLAPERLHSHAKKDSRGLMYRKSPTLDIKMTSPQKKVVPDIAPKPKSTNKDKAKDSPESKKDCGSIKSQSEDDKSSTELCSDECSSTDLCSDGSCSTELCSDEKELVELVKACYICQKEFKVSALLLHESKCLEGWKKTNNALTPNLRKLPPRRPEDDDDLPSDEADPQWTSVQSQLVPCSVCGRTFFPERLPVHRRVCKGKPSPRPLKRASSLREQSSASSRDGEDLRPAAIYVPCYVCGRNYGSWVISMHEQQCLKRWRSENEKLPCSEQKDEPKKFSERFEDEDVASLIELGDTAWESHLQQLVPCPLCSRTFFPDRLGVHKRSCKGPATASRRPRSNKGT